MYFFNLENHYFILWEQEGSAVSVHREEEIGGAKRAGESCTLKLNGKLHTGKVLCVGK